MSDAAVVVVLLGGVGVVFLLMWLHDQLDPPHTE